METSTGDEEKCEQRISSEKLRYDPGSKRIEGNKVGRNGLFTIEILKKRGMVQWTVCARGVIGRSGGAQIFCRNGRERTDCALNDNRESCILHRLW